MGYRLHFTFLLASVCFPILSNFKIEVNFQVFSTFQLFLGVYTEIVSNLFYTLFFMYRYQIKRGQEQNREETQEGEMAPKSWEEGEIGGKSREEGEIGGKSREEGENVR